MGAKWLRSWAGGRVRDVDGREVWVIERRIGDGRRRVLALDAANEKQALAELALFERAPGSYQPRAALPRPGAEALIDAETLKEFARYVDTEAGLSEGYRRHILRPYLADWGAALKGRDIRRLELVDLTEILKTWKTSRHHRIVALRSLTSWMRETGRLRRQEDPTLDLKVPQARPEKAVRVKGYPAQIIERLYATLGEQRCRDVIVIRSKLGMHDTEIGRIARGEALLRRLDNQGEIAGTITFPHLKAGKIHVVSADAQTLAAAERIQAQGAPLSRMALKRMLDKAVEKIRKGLAQGQQFPDIRPGELRHSYATWARNVGRIVRPQDGGVPLAEVAAVLGHSSARTTSRFYDGTEVPPLISLPLKLKHPDDPLPISKASRRKAAR